MKPLRIIGVVIVATLVFGAVRGATVNLLEISVGAVPT